MMPAPIRVLVVALALVACGPSARQQTLRATYVAATSAKAGFLAWDREQMQHISRMATSVDDGLAKIAAYKDKRSPVVGAFEAVFHLLAEAAIDDDRPLADALKKTEDLRQSLRVLTNGRLP